MNRCVMGGGAEAGGGVAVWERTSRWDLGEALRGHHPALQSRESLHFFASVSSQNSRDCSLRSCIKICFKE